MSEEDYSVYETIPTTSRRDRNTEEEVAQPQLENLYDFLNQFGGQKDMQVSVLKQNRKGKFEHIDTYTLAEMNGVMDLLREELGGGVYRFRLFQQGDKRPCREWEQSFAPKPRFSRDYSSSSGVASPTPPTPPPLGQSDALTVLIQKLDQQTQLLQQFFTTRQIPVEDAEEKLLRTMTLLKALIPPPPVQHTDPLEMLTRTMEVVRGFLPPPEGSNPIDLVRDIVRGMGDTLRAQPRQAQLTGTTPPGTPPGTPPVLRPVSMPSTESAYATSLPTEPPQEHPKMDTLRLAVTYLINAAKVGLDPLEIADEMYLQLDTELLRSFVDDPNWLQRLTNYDFRAPEYRDWLERLRVSLIDTIRAADEDGNIEG